MAFHQWMLLGPFCRSFILCTMRQIQNPSRNMSLLWMCFPHQKEGECWMITVLYGSIGCWLVSLMVGYKTNCCEKVVYWLTDILTDWLLAWLVCWLIDGCMDWLVDCLIGWWILGCMNWFIDGLIDWLIDWLIGWLVGYVVDWIVLVYGVNGICKLKISGKRKNYVLRGRKTSSPRVQPSLLPFFPGRHVVQLALGRS